eukprot:NODE_1332_length_618_cov_157.119192_g1320_i0.p1 GENE.NODE_1332_length_618_cov_157.119192_g1320_i0~~NODE_1332_length_618_cov_157.119192_g1320_i0.p1  ORF type:complete len:163 (-),score=24.00 NODE_1332_length_618_cov_157.119192_g1320_i0:81-569(-)
MYSALVSTQSTWDSSVHNISRDITFTPVPLDPQHIQEAVEARSRETPQWETQIEEDQSWQPYPPGAQRVLENAYQAGEERCTVDIYDVPYTVSLAEGIQIRQDDPSRIRSVRRRVLQPLNIPPVEEAAAAEEPVAMTAEGQALHGFLQESHFFSDFNPPEAR